MSSCCSRKVVKKSTCILERLRLLKIKIVNLEMCQKCVMEDYNYNFEVGGRIIFSGVFKPTPRKKWSDYSSFLANIQRKYHMFVHSGLI